MSKADKKRKIIEIYITENKEEDSVCFDVEKVENTEIADYTMKMLLHCFSQYQKEDDELEVEYE